METTWEIEPCSSPQQKRWVLLRGSSESIRWFRRTILKEKTSIAWLFFFRTAIKVRIWLCSIYFISVVGKFIRAMYSFQELMLRLVMQFFVKKKITLCIACTLHKCLWNKRKPQIYVSKSQEFVSFLYSFVDHMVGLDSTALHHRLKTRYMNTRFWTGLR